MTKKEFIDRYKECDTLSDVSDEMDKDLDELIRQTISEYEQRNWFEYPKNKPEDKWRGMVTCISLGSLIIIGEAEYNEEDGFFGYFASGSDWNHEDFKIIAWRNYPKPYKPQSRINHENNENNE